MNRKIAITLPVSWQEVTDRQLYYLYDLFLDNLSADQIKTYCFFLWGKIRIECRYDEHDYIVRHDKETFKVSRELIASAIHELDWIVEIPEYPVRISRIRKHAALPADFQGVEFEKYIYCDNLYQGYLSTQKQELLNEMAGILYNAPGIKTNAAEKLQEAMNAQIRALTKGDITKEREVLSMDTWRALAELDAQAKEYEELKKQYGK